MPRRRSDARLHPTAHLCILFSHMQKAGFLMTRLIWIIEILTMQPKKKVLITSG